MIKQEETTSLKGLVYWVGMGLVAVSALSLVYIAILVVGLIQSPMESELIVWVSRTFGQDESLLSGYISDAPFEIHVDETLQYLLLGMIGLVAIGILTSVLRGLLTSGVSLIQLSRMDGQKRQ